MTTVRPPITAVLPAYNEANTIGPLCLGLQRYLPEGSEILVVDDGSTDGTGEESRKAGATVLRLTPNRGKGEALRRGIEAARGELLLFMDADGQDHPADVPALLEAMNGADMVIGSRFIGTFQPGAITKLNYAGTQFLTTLLNTLFRSKVTDTQAGFKIVRRNALDGVVLKATRFDIEVELLLQLLKKGRKVIEVPVTRSPRAHGKSRLNSFRDGTIILRRILQQYVQR